MDRGEFLKCCALGLCSCASPVVLARSTTGGGAPEVEELKWKRGFVHNRFAKLIQILKQRLDEPTLKTVLEELGTECSKQYDGLINKYKNDPTGFLQEIRNRWAATAEYDEKTGAIRVTEKASTCTCSLVQKGLTPPEFCHCTIGWQRRTYSAVLGKPVEVELEESILRGGKRCIFRIRPAQREAYF